jgi:hypothetical protein
MARLTDLTRPLFPKNSGGGETEEERRKQWEFYKMILKYVYWIIGLGVLVTVCYLLYNNYSRPVASILIFMGGIITLYFYYIKWFFIDNSMKREGGSSLCPDYLTPVSPGYQKNWDGTIKPNTDGSTFKCVDFVGVSKNGALLKSTAANITTALNDSNYSVTISPSMKPADIKNMLAAKGLTWISMFSDDV